MKTTATGDVLVATEVGVLPDIRRGPGELWWPVSVNATDGENASVTRQVVENVLEASRRCDLACQLARARYTAKRMAARWSRYLGEISGRGVSGEAAANKPGVMPLRYQRLGKADLHVSSIGLGRVTFGREIDAATSFAVLDRAGFVSEHL